MKKILLVSKNSDTLSRLVQKAGRNGVDTLWVSDAMSALDQIGKDTFDVVVAEDDLPDMDGRKFVEKLVMKNPMQQCVIISRLPEEEFHEAFEGLGVLMRFPEHPGEEEFIALEKRFAAVSGMISGVKKG